MSEDVWLIVWLAVLAVYCVAQLWWTRQHERNLRAHNERIRGIYEDHDERMRRIYEGDR